MRQQVAWFDCAIQRGTLCAQLHRQRFRQAQIEADADDRHMRGTGQQFDQDAAYAHITLNNTIEVDAPYGYLSTVTMPLALFSAGALLLLTVLN